MKQKLIAKIYVSEYGQTCSQDYGERVTFNGEISNLTIAINDDDIDEAIKTKSFDFEKGWNSKSVNISFSIGKNKRTYNTGYCVKESLLNLLKNTTVIKGDNLNLNDGDYNTNCISIKEKVILTKIGRNGFGLVLKDSEEHNQLKLELEELKDILKTKIKKLNVGDFVSILCFSDRTEDVQYLGKHSIIIENDEKKKKRFIFQNNKNMFFFEKMPVLFNRTEGVDFPVELIMQEMSNKRIYCRGIDKTKIVSIS